MKSFFFLVFFIAALSPIASHATTERANDRMAQGARGEPTWMQDRDDVGGALSRRGLDADLIQILDVAYGPHERHRMDVYRPGRAVQGAPIILMVHGGGWIRGDKTHRRTLVNKANYFTRHGMIFISTNYRLVPDATPLEQTDDIAMALAFVQKNAQSWGGHADKVILMGHSAGAHLVSLINSDPSIAAAQGARPWRAVVSLDSAAYDLPKTYNNNLGLRWIYRRAFGDDEKTLRLSSPSHRLRPGGAPLLAVCSQLRADRPCDDASDFVQKLIKIGGRGAVLPISMTHGDINDMLGVTNPYTAQVMDFISTYIDP